FAAPVLCGAGYAVVRSRIPALQEGRAERRASACPRPRVGVEFYPHEQSHHGKPKDSGVPRAALYRSAPTSPVDCAPPPSPALASVRRGLNLCLARGRLPRPRPPHPAPRLVTLMKRSFNGAGFRKIIIVAANCQEVGICAGYILWLKCKPL